MTTFPDLLDLSEVMTRAERTRKCVAMDRRTAIVHYRSMCHCSLSRRDGGTGPESDDDVE